MANITLMGWNQVVRVSTDGGSTFKPYKVSDYSVGITQNFEVPQMVSGRSDRMTWSKGVIEVGGTINVPLLASTGVIGGSNVWLTAAEEAAVPVNSDGTINNSAILYIKSTVHPQISNSMIQTFTITANEGQPIQLTMEMFGTLLDDNNENTPISNAGISLNFSSTANAGADAQDAVLALGATGSNEDRIGGDPIGSDISTDTDTMRVEEIPMFDVVYGIKENLPVDQNNNPVGEPVSWSFTINNNLIRNYVLGSARGLDAFSIASGQRELTGEATWVSLGAAEGTYNGTIGQVINVGVRESNQDIWIAGTTDPTAIGTTAPGDAIFAINMSQALILWGARPPQLNTGKVTCSANYQLIARDGSGSGPTGADAQGFIQLQP